MGCCIHLHSEIKIYGKWYHHSECNISRNYALFAKMAGVRNWSGSGISPIAEIKGIPDDVTFLTKIDIESHGSDGHSYSFLNAEEINELHNFIRDDQHGYFLDDLNYNALLQDQLPYFIGYHFDGFIKYPDQWEGVEDVRYVFFFDN